METVRQPSALWRYCHSGLNRVDALRGIVDHGETLWRASQRIDHG